MPAEKKAKIEAKEEAQPLKEFIEEEPGMKAKFLSGMAYAGMLPLLFVLFVPLNILAFFISRSKYTRYNCLQALVFFTIDLALNILLFALFVVAVPMILAFVAPFFGFASPAAYAPVVLIIGLVALIATDIIASAVFIACGVFCFLGHTVSVPGLSKWAEQFAS